MASDAPAGGRRPEGARAGRHRLVDRHPVGPDARGHRRLRLDEAAGARRPTARPAPQVTVAAARRGLALFDDSWAIGLWTFSTKLDGNRDYRELVGIGPLSAQRSELERALPQVRPKDGSRTGLYDTVLAAYKEVQDGWEPGRVNSIVLFTDGKNEDDPGVSAAPSCSPS